MLDAVQKNFLLNPPAHRTKTKLEQATHCVERFFTEYSMTSPSPVVGDWYRRPGGALFEVVAIDRDDASATLRRHARRVRPGVVGRAGIRRSAGTRGLDRLGRRRCGRYRS